MSPGVRQNFRTRAAVLAPVGAVVLAAAVAALPGGAWAGTPAATPTAAAATPSGATPTATATVPGSATPAPAAAAAPSGAPDFTMLGFPDVIGSTDYTPGTAATVMGNSIAVALPAAFYANPATFDLLSASPDSFASIAGGRSVVSAFAFRVTDKTTGQLVGSFASPVLVAITDPAVTPQTIVLNVGAGATAATVNGTPPTISDQTASHTFGGAGVGWLLANPAQGAAAATTAPPPPAPPPPLPSPAATQAPVATPRVVATPAAAPPSGAPPATSVAVIPVSPSGPVVVQGPALVQSPPKGPISLQAPVTKAGAPKVGAPTAGRAPRLPNTGTGGLLSGAKSGVDAVTAVVLLAGASLLGLAGAIWRRRPAR